MEQLPKPLFPEVGRMYQAVVAAGVDPGALNKDRADTVIRSLSRTNWRLENQDIYATWNSHGEIWNQLIKDVRSYSKEVSKHRRQAAKKPKD